MNYTYLLVGAGLGGFSYYAYNNSEILFPYIFKIVNFYHETVDYYAKTEEKPIKRKHSRINLICYNTTNKEEMVRQDIKEVIDTETNKQYDLKIIEKNINDKLYYKRLYENDLNNLINDNHFFLGFLDNKPFLQISYDDGFRKTDIHLQLKPFYIDRSRILDKKFMIWFMLKYFSYDITDKKYTLSIMDNNIKMFEIGKNDYIILRNDNTDYYEVVTDEKI
jgi:hypothetical protein